MSFPDRRLRRLRRTSALRRLVAETRLSVDDVVAPLFVREGIDGPAPIASLPGVVQHSRESLRKEVAALADLGVPAVILFGVPATKDEEGSGAWDPEGIADNDATLERYARVARAQADAGADVVAPSGMMDGQVAAIRRALDEGGHLDTPVLAYAAKYASALYGPFRDAVDVTIADGGDRRAYQQDPRNGREALVEVALDVE